jgi:hypothetical protein
LVNCIDSLDKCKAACCRVLVFTISNPSQDRLNYFKLHDCKIERLDRAHYRVIVPAVCNELDENNLCKLHDSGKKPLLCKRFDENHLDGYYIPTGCIYGRS